MKKYLFALLGFVFASGAQAGQLEQVEFHALRMIMKGTFHLVRWEGASAEATHIEFLPRALMRLKGSISVSCESLVQTSAEPAQFFSCTLRDNAGAENGSEEQMNSRSLEFTLKKAIGDTYSIVPLTKKYSIKGNLPSS